MTRKTKKSLELLLTVLFLCGSTGSRDGLSMVLPTRSVFNRADFPWQPPPRARFFVIKSYSEEDVLRSIQYGMWSSTGKRPATGPSGPLFRPVHCFSGSASRSSFRGAARSRI
eukprot:1180112-Prorocentrum_minimum.AAC.5